MSSGMMIKNSFKRYYLAKGKLKTPGHHSGVKKYIQTDYFTLNVYSSNP